MVVDWPGGYHRYCDPKSSVVADRFDVALYRRPTGLRRAYAGIFMFAIPRSVHDLPAALDLLRFLTNEENQVLEARKGALAVRPAVQQRMEAEAKPGSRDARRNSAARRRSSASETLTFALAVSTSIVAFWEVRLGKEFRRLASGHRSLGGLPRGLVRFDFF